MCAVELEICSETVNSVQTAIYCLGLAAKGLLLARADLIQKQKLTLYYWQNKVQWVSYLLVFVKFYLDSHPFSEF